MKRLFERFFGGDLKTHTFRAFNGTSRQMYYRDGTSDWNTLMAGLEQDEYQFSKLAFKPGDTAVDIGSHIGAISTLLATLGMKVISVEALPENVRMQKKNLKHNRLASNVRILHKAIASTSGGKTKIFYGDLSEECGRHHQFIGTSSEFKHFFGKGKSATVPTISINDVFDRCGIQKCALLKIDVEGAEWSAAETVRDDVWDRIDLFLGEWHTMGPYKSRKQMLELTRGKFVDLSEEYGMAPNDFLFKHK